MPFIPIRRPGMGEPPFEYYQMTDAESAVLGEVLVQTSGKLTKSGATTKPQFVAMANAIAATPGARIPVVRVGAVEEWETTSIATVASTLVGSKVTVHTDGLQVTATTTSGVFEISNTDGATTTSRVRGRFN